MADIVQEYFPSAKARIRIRLEEYEATDVRAQAPKGVQQDKDLTHGVPAVPRVVLSYSKTTNQYGYETFVLTNPKKPTIASNDRLLEVTVIPKKASWKQNGIRTADKLDLTLRWSDFPIDPRAIRSSSVRFYLGTVTPEEFSAGVSGYTRASHAPYARNAEETMNVVPDKFVQGGVERSNLRFIGWVDLWEIDWSDGEPAVHLECRDNTQLIHDLKMPTLCPGLSTKLPIHEAVAKFLTNFPQMEDLTVEYRPPPNASEKTPIPQLGKVIQANAPTPGASPGASPVNASVPPTLQSSMAASALGAGGRGPAQARTGGSDEGQSVWEYICDNVLSMGLSVRVEDMSIIIEEVRSIIDASRKGDPYAPRIVDGVAFKNRAMIYGRNILEMKIKRGFTRKRPQNIEVRSWDFENKRVNIGQWPKKAARAVTPTANAGPQQVEEPWHEVRVAGGIPQKFLERIAINYYEAQGRQEIAVHIKTRNLASFGAANADPDLLDVRPGDTVEVLLDKDATSTIADVTERVRRVRDFFTSMGYPPEFASHYVSIVQDKGFQTLFVAKELSFDWDTEDGVTIEMDCINYVVVRADKGDGDAEAKDDERQKQSLSGQT